MKLTVREFPRECLMICLLFGLSWGAFGADELRFRDVSLGTDGISLAWSGCSGGQYRIQTTADLKNGWTNGPSLSAVSNVISWTDSEALQGCSRFYAVKVDRKPIKQVGNWVYNIQCVDTPGQREELVGTHFDMYVLEPVVTEKDMESFDIAGLVRDIRAHVVSNYHKNPLILAYVDVGQAEDWRWYWQAGWQVGSPEWIVGADPDDWTGCYPVAYWHPQWQDIVIYGGNGRSHVEETLKAGFDGIYLDWVEAFSDTNVVAKAAQEGTNTVSAMFDFIEKIRTYARQISSHANPDYLVVAQNASDLYQEDTNRYEQLVDAIALEAIWYDGDEGFDDWNDPRGYNVPTDSLHPGWTEEVLGHLEPLKGRLPIFCCEYAQDINGNNLASLVYTNLAPTNGFIPYCTRRSLQRLSNTPYPADYWPLDY